jgi:hypothetical protein
MNIAVAKAHTSIHFQTGGAEEAVPAILTFLGKISSYASSEVVKCYLSAQIGSFRALIMSHISVVYTPS